MAVLYKLALHATDHVYLVSVIDCHDFGLNLAAPQSELRRKSLELFLTKTFQEALLRNTQA